ncbi:MAG TPA: cupin domain-containing protein [Mycobacterium sp.]
MNTLKHRPSLFAVLAGLLVGLAAIIIGTQRTVMATPSSGFASTVTSASGVAELNLKTLSAEHQVRIKTKGFSDVHIASNVVSPGGHSGWHTHPGPSVVVVKSGRATLYDGDDPTCTPQVVEAGGAFVDIGGGQLHLVRNENTVPLELIAFQVVPAGATRRIDAPDPGFCGF